MDPFLDPQDAGIAAPVLGTALRPHVSIILLKVRRMTYHMDDLQRVLSLGGPDLGPQKGPDLARMVQSLMARYASL